MVTAKDKEATIDVYNAIIGLRDLADMTDVYEVMHTIRAESAEQALKEFVNKLYDVRSEPDKLNCIIMHERAAIIAPLLNEAPHA